MAILPDLPGVEVTIQMDGVAMKEYDDVDEVDTNGDELKQYQASKTVSKYIECLNDKEFSIALSVNQFYQFTSAAIKFETKIDGKIVDSYVLEKAGLNGRSGWSKIFAGARVIQGGNWKIRPFKFQAIKTTREDSHSIDHDIARIADIGEIAIWVCRSSKPKSRKNPQKDRELKLRKKGVVHEKALASQAKSHHTLFGEARATYGWKSVSSKIIDDHGKPIAIYKFKYRSLEALQSLLVVPREPELEPEPKVDLLSPPLPDHASLREGVENTNPDLVDLNTATPEEKRLMALMLGTLRAHSSSTPQVKTEAPSIKRESGHVGGSRKRIKREENVVDLTDD